MKIRTLELQNFKAFKDAAPFDFEGKNVLIFGNNGSGKSSLCYALHVFLQSSIAGKDWQKYFVPHGTYQSEHSLLNIYADPAALPPYIRLTMDNDDRYELSPQPTAGWQPASSAAAVRLANLASDFLNHRLVFNFSNFRNSQDANIWWIFEREVLPYWIYENATQKTFESELDEIRMGFEQLSKIRKRDKSGQLRGKSINSNDYLALKERIEKLNKRIESDYRQNEPMIKTLLSDYFLKEDQYPFNVTLAFRRYIGISPDNKWKLEYPELILKAERNGVPIHRPHTFLNEARLTALALSIRLAMFNQRYKGTSTTNDLKILLLDDLLISMDMSNRMKVIRYLRDSELFNDYQFIILTHDKGFFEILKQNLITDKNHWKWFEFYENTSKVKSPSDYINPICIEDVCPLKKAEWYLDGRDSKGNPFPKDLEAAALYLRKKTEELVRIYFDPTLEEYTRFKVLYKLSRSLESIPKSIDSKLQWFFQKIINNAYLTDEELREYINFAIEIPEDSSEEDKRKFGKFRALESKIGAFLSKHLQKQNEWEEDKNKLIVSSNKVNEIRGRILNLGAHTNHEPIYEAELREALGEIRNFESSVLGVIGAYREALE